MMRTMGYSSAEDTIAKRVINIKEKAPVLYRGFFVYTLIRKKGFYVRKSSI